MPTVLQPQKTQNFVAYLAEHSSVLWNTEELCYLSWAGCKGKEEGMEGGGCFSLADKYSNQMSVPLWDSGAQIQDIPWYGLIKNKKKSCVGRVRVDLRVKKKGAKWIIYLLDVRGQFSCYRKIH